MFTPEFETFKWPIPMESLCEHEYGRLKVSAFTSLPASF